MHNVHVTYMIFVIVKKNEKQLNYLRITMFYILIMDFSDLQNNSSNQVADNLDDIDKNIDIYLKQRNGRKYTTTIHGLNCDKDTLKMYAKDLRKLLGCSCSLDKHEETDETILKLSGKDTVTICNYLVENLNIKKENIVIHGN